MIAEHAPQAAALSGADLCALQRAFDEICTRRGIAKGTVSATNVAAELIAIFQAGIRDEKQLVAMMTGEGVFP